MARTAGPEIALARDNARGPASLRRDFCFWANSEVSGRSMPLGSRRALSRKALVASAPVARQAAARSAASLLPRESDRPGWLAVTSAFVAKRSSGRSARDDSSWAIPLARTTRRDRDPDARFSEKRSHAMDGAGRGGDRCAGRMRFDACFHAIARGDACTTGRLQTRPDVGRQLTDREGGSPVGGRPHAP
jgi:hypothetical protein